MCQEPKLDLEDEVRARKIPGRSLFSGLAMLLVACSVSAGADLLAAPAPTAPPDAQELRSAPPVAPAATPLDRSGRKRVGKASFYAKKFAGKKMADGTIMHPESDNAASTTLPLGTTAKVTNLATGQSALITIRDRGPYAKGMIVDLSPSTARQIGISGVGKVELTPISFPQRDGSDHARR